jgi:hypothetical protein
MLYIANGLPVESLVFTALVISHTRLHHNAATEPLRYYGGITVRDENTYARLYGQRRNIIKEVNISLLQSPPH